MAQLRQDFAEFEKRGAVILVVGPENSQAFSRYFREHDLPFTGLPDAAHAVLKLYGQQINLFKFGRMPAQLLVDRAGMVRFICYGKDMTDIPTNAEMLALIDEIDAGFERGPTAIQTVISGVIVEGYRVASGPSKDYPYGTLEKQIPLFKERGLDLEHFFYGTLNVSIAPNTFEMVNPEYTFRQVVWTDLHPPEDFSFSPCTLRFRGVEYASYVYYPHPETKKRHFENNSLIEIISVFIPEIQYGDKVEMALDAEEIRIRERLE